MEAVQVQFLCSFVGGSSAAPFMRSRKTGQQMHNPLTARQGFIFPSGCAEFWPYPVDGSERVEKNLEKPGKTL